MHPTEQNFAKAAMLIRKPVATVFNAFTDPAITTKIWFTKSSGKLEKGKSVEWTWEMYHHTVPVTVLDIKENQKIEIEWGNYKDKSTVSWTFTELDNAGTFVTIINSGFEGNNEQIITQVRDSTEGFTLVLAGLKALLEYDVQLHLVGDRFPGGIPQT